MNVWQEWRSNARLRWGMWLIVLMMGIYSILFVDDYRQQLRADYIAQGDKLRQLQSVNAQQVWTQRSQQSAQVLKGLEAQVATAGSQGLAQANFQAWLNRQFFNAQLVNPRLQVEPAQKLSDIGLWRVTAKIDGKYTPENMLRFLRTIAIHSKLVVVDKLHIRTIGRDQHYNLILQTYFKLDKS